MWTPQNRKRYDVEQQTQRIYQNVALLATSFGMYPFFDLFARITIVHPS
jgi:hypothetical protein